MFTIHKYTIPLQDHSVIKIPYGRQFLSAQVQDGHIVVWFLVDNTKPTGPVDVYLYGTGHPVHHSSNFYKATVQLNDFVWHLFILAEATDRGFERLVHIPSEPETTNRGFVG